MSARLVWMILGLLSLVPWGAGARAASVSLSGWAFNIDGQVRDIAAGNPLPGGVDARHFDANTGLGTITVTVQGGGTHFIGLFVDHDIEPQGSGFAPEFGTLVGTPAGGQSWEIDEPGFNLPFGDIFANLVMGQLDNMNGVPMNLPNDVSMAMGWDVLLGANEMAQVTFVLRDITGSVVPPGFVLTQSEADPRFQGTIALTSTLSISPTAIPEPGTWLLLASGLVGLRIGRRRWRWHVV